MITGIAASDGFAIGVAVQLIKKEIIVDTKTAQSIPIELKVLETSVIAAIKQLNKIYEKTRIDLGEEEANVFESHLMMLEDPEFIGLIKKNIEENNHQAPYAIELAKDFYVQLFETLDNEYMRARSADIKDVANRLMRISLGEESDTLIFPEHSIIIAHDLTPSDTAQLDKKKVIGFITEVGSKTSHSAIMARSMGIPAILGVSEVCKQLKNGTKIIMDGDTGNIYPNPDDPLLTDYSKKIVLYNESIKALSIYKDITLEYTSGRPLTVAGNIGSPDDLDLLIEQGAQGVGLFRTEFLFMGRNSMPSEDEQYNVYKQVAETMSDANVVIRTLDIGGDKVIPYITMPKEDNPFLGLRALRLCFHEHVLFKTQLRALLRASVYGSIHIMFPMIGSIDELHQAKSILEECKVELQQEGIPFDNKTPIGMMIEIPAAAISAKEFAKEVDFFSIGTNDLIQYTLAVDRMNPHVANLYNPFHPAIISLIKTTIQAAHDAGIWCGMCGEMASDTEAISLLTQLELDEFSVTGSQILKTKEHLLKQECVKSIPNNVTI